MENTTKKTARLACWALLASRSASHPGLSKGIPFNSTSSGTAGAQLIATSALQMPLQIHAVVSFFCSFCAIRDKLEKARYTTSLLAVISKGLNEAVIFAIGRSD
eukprot:CAMPEP_0172417252 /NCGR_PEP_ID=MMETSP1064-20121228/3777_1 /TAXON_ID=202472 /ORGANISM="Aulacoseira subarctica , Strain CCAP 1002/5" /LENGTH=103 /DNA_ID=CAMNT_0013155467 /DNA_START=982 /DNA_END=1293 /DNA_ORIENTATION=+